MTSNNNIEEIKALLEGQQYICSDKIAVVIFLALKMGKPVLVEGPAGVGKTSLAQAISSALKRKLIRMQCYEGLDESKALYEWEYSKQLLYTQILRDKIGEMLKDCGSLSDALEKISKQGDIFFSDRFLLPRPILKAIRESEPTVLLIDEIDRADLEFEAFLLEVLSDFQVSVPELGTIKAENIPLVIITSNNTRELSEALKRRCLYLYIDYPAKAEEMKIINVKVPGIDNLLSSQIVDVIRRIRMIDLKKKPGISETLDWAFALTILNINSLDEEVVRNTLNVIIKYEQDLQKVNAEAGKIVTISGN